MDEIYFNIMDKYIANKHIVNDDSLAGIFILSPIVLLWLLLLIVLILHVLQKKDKKIHRIVGYALVSFIESYSMLCYLNFFIGLPVSGLIVIFVIIAKNKENTYKTEYNNSFDIKKENLYCLISYFLGILVWLLVFLIFR